MKNRPDARNGSARTPSDATRKGRKSRKSTKPKTAAQLNAKAKRQRKWPPPHVCAVAKIKAIIDAAGLPWLPPDSQAAAVLLVEHARTTRHRHALCDEAIAIDYHFKRLLFRQRDMDRVVDALFTRAGNGHYSPKKGIAIGYLLRPEIEAVAASFDWLIDENAVVIDRGEVRPLALDCTHWTGGPSISDARPLTSMWLPVNVAAIHREVVGLDQVRAEYPDFEDLLQYPEQFCPYPAIVRAAEHDARVLREVHRDLRHLLPLADHPDHPGEVFQQFRRSLTTGRRNGIGPYNLQNIRRIVRQVALEGCQQIDVSSCHHSIAQQIARDAAVETPLLDIVIADKDGWRKRLAEAIGCSTRTAKRVTLAITFGASTTGPDDTELAKLLGVEGRARAAAYGPLRRLIQELRMVGRLIDARWPTAPDPVTGRRPVLRKRTARHLQRVESGALLAMLETQTTVCLPMHDGFIMPAGIDPGLDALMKRIVAKVDKKLKLTTETVQIPGLQLATEP